MAVAGNNATAFGTSATGATVTLAWSGTPTIAVNSLLLMVVSTARTTLTYFGAGSGGAVPSGWTQFGQNSWPGGSDPTKSIALYWKKAVSGEILPTNMAGYASLGSTTPVNVTYASVIELQDNNISGTCAGIWDTASTSPGGLASFTISNVSSSSTTITLGTGTTTGLVTGMNVQMSAGTGVIPGYTTISSLTSTTIVLNAAPTTALSAATIIVSAVPMATERAAIGTGPFACNVTTSWTATYADPVLWCVGLTASNVITTGSFSGYTAGTTGPFAPFNTASVQGTQFQGVKSIASATANTFGFSTNSAGIQAMGAYTTSFNPTATPVKTQTATAQISHTQSNPQNATAQISVTQSTTQGANASISPAATIRTNPINATAGISKSVTGPLQPATSRILNGATVPIGATALIDPPPWSPRILMGSGNSFDQVLGSQYFELSANINGGSSANDQTYFLDGGRSV